MAGRFEITRLGHWHYQLQPILAGFRKTAGLTQADMAKRLGVTQQTYSAAERNAANMSVGNLMKALQALDVELVWLAKAGMAGYRQNIPKSETLKKQQICCFSLLKNTT